jgi:pimeloyl-ACP methyl ester carboxylesterase
MPVASHNPSGISIPGTVSRFLEPTGPADQPRGRLRYLTGGTGAPLVLLHTVRTQAEHFRNLIALVKDRFTVYALDLPGWATRRSCPARRMKSLPSFIAARSRYREVSAPVHLIYGESDWSRWSDRQANKMVFPSFTQVADAGHFIALERPDVPAVFLNQAA